MALFSRGDRTFNLELSREGTVVIERLHVGDALPNTTSHGSEYEALAAYKRRFRDIVIEGWHVMLGDADLARPVACDPAIESAISLDDAEQLTVYADWLIERGDPCGELAQMRAREERESNAELAASIAELEEMRADEIFGVFTSLPNHGQVRYVWHNGWVEAVEITNVVRAPPYRNHPDSSLGTLVAIALLAPIARFVRRMSFLRLHTADLRSAIATSPRRDSIRRLDTTARRHMQELFDALPRLEQIQMPAGAVTKGHETVHTITLTHGTDAPPNDLLPGEWPALRTLAITSGRDISAALATLAERPFMQQLGVLQINAPLETPIVKVLREALPNTRVEEA